jgi:hypothetical protein
MTHNDVVKIGPHLLEAPISPLRESLLTPNT